MVILLPRSWRLLRPSSEIIGEAWATLRRALHAEDFQVPRDCARPGEIGPLVGFGHVAFAEGAAIHQFHAQHQ